MNLSDYEYELPEERIAQYPSSERDASRLMVLDRVSREIYPRHFRDLTEFLRPGDCLVVNETRVFPARLSGCRPRRGGAVGLLLVRKEGELWEVLARPGRRLQVGAEVEFPEEDLRAVVEAVLPSGHRMVRFWGETPLDTVLERRGHIPLPPYIRREDEPADRERYQAVYARTSGAVAAPTAGLHFTPELLERIREMGVIVAPVLLHVGPGTFKPVSVEDPRQHEMDAEYFEVGQEAANAVNTCRANGGRVVAVGTTSVRVLESAARAEGKGWVLQPETGWTRLFVYPPYKFRLVDALITNFHLPRSTLLMLVAAFAGREFMLEAYRKAVEQEYRFYSYGDAMLIV
ncbi:MAG: tRNA preQ1(34) S-adenosylmethionine ribosyltransferase-isomerase QueA [bacterium]|nr:tRNA preQ1(34) S-adenosylmethionine ribosyltransferase-isomerase QueA [bacterium]